MNRARFIWLAIALLALSAAASAFPLHWNLPPWECGERDPAGEQVIAEQERAAQVNFARLTRDGRADEEEFRGNLEALMRQIREGTEAFADRKGLDPQETLVRFISAPVVLASETDIVPYLIRKGREDLALFYVQWLARQLGFENLLGVYPIGAHAHNDYEHRAPLFNAMLLGFDSIEADVYVLRKSEIEEDGSYARYLEQAGIYGGRDVFFLLRHGPTWSYLKSSLLGFDFDVEDPGEFPEFEEYYLRPLARFADEHPEIAEIRKLDPLRILVDFKSAAYAMFDPFEDLAERYKHILTWFEWNEAKGAFDRHDGFVQIVISGFDGPLEFRPARHLLDSACNHADRFVLLDGRIDDGKLHRRLEACGLDFDLDYTPMISRGWSGVSESEVEDVLALDPRFDAEGLLRRSGSSGVEHAPAARAAAVATLASKLSPAEIEKSHGLRPPRPIRLYGEPKLGCGTLPERRAFQEAVWEIAYQACVDIINTDDLRGLYWFLLEKKLRELDDPGSVPACRRAEAASPRSDS